MCLSRARVSLEMSFDDQQLPVGLTPGMELVIKQVLNIDNKDMRELAEHETEVLKSLSGTHYVPKLYGSYTSHEVGPRTGGLRQCANLILE